VVEHYRSVLGWIDVAVVFGSDRAWRPVGWVTTKSEPKTTIRGFYDVNIPVNKAVRNTITIGGHALVTGPNRGGKSSVMRGILQAVLSAQTWGVVHNADDVLMTTPYSAFYTRLVSADRPGVASLFESDVHYALDVLRGCSTLCDNSRNPFIMIDELFHSTNPADAEASATYFLRQLWKTGASSLISTHIFNLLEKAPASVGRLCLKASKRTDGTIEYTYMLGEGTCTVSSVGEVWTSVSASASASESASAG
jgi:DNA mismatch repair ATPase MutS